MKTLSSPLSRIKGLNKAKTISGLASTAADLLAAYRAQDIPSLIICKNENDALITSEHLKAFDLPNTHLFPAWDILPEQTDDIDESILAQRTQVLRLLADSSESTCIVASAEALLQPVIPLETFIDKLFSLRVGMEIERNELIAMLDGAGLIREMTASTPGEFAIKGAVIDIFPYSSDEPVRIEFFDDEIESIRIYNPLTQETRKQLKNFGLHEIPLSDLKAATYATTPHHIDEYFEGRTQIICFDEDSLAPLFKNNPSLWQEFIKRKSLNITPFDKPDDRSAIRMQYMDMTEIQNKHKDFASWFAQEQFQIHFFCHNGSDLSQIKELCTARLPQIPLTFSNGILNGAIVLPEQGLVLMSPADILEHLPKDSAARHIPKRQRASISSFTELEEGDFIVHSMHGIGRFMYMETITRPNGSVSDCLAIMYAGNSKLLIPMTNLYLIQKYIGISEDKIVQLDKLGAKTWQRKRKKAHEGILKMAHELLEIQAQREKFTGFACCADTAEQKRFESEFIYEDTPDQSISTAEIKKDMESNAPMDRLLCGDVGFGKTEVAMRAAFKAVQSGKQVAVLVPTTILAEQHYRSFCERMKNFAVLIEVIDRFRSPAEQKQVIEKLGRGSVDILIGTHRILSKDVSFNDLGLIIIDEEQRFGVKAKESLKRFRSTVDILTMSATPIPRTLHMGFLTIKDISTLKTPPAGRVAIKTQVLRYDEKVIKEAIIRELERGGQVYFVHNRVNSIGAIVNQLSQLIPDVPIGILHGQMNGDQAEKAMMAFLKGSTKILVATTIIESGLDIPNVNTIFINNANNYGLSNLHQLRGRIGRYKYNAFAYFLTDPEKDLNPKAERRLKAIANFSAVGAGFDLAMQDMEIRGAGNLLGKSQSGHMESIGYELYCHMLKDTISQLRGERIAQEIEVSISLGQETFIPDDYIADHRHKIEIYRALSEFKSTEQIDNFAGDIIDQYGKYPESVRALIEESKIVLLSRQLGISKISISNHDIHISTAGIDTKEIVGLLIQNNYNVKRVTEKTIIIPAKDSSVPGQVRLMLQSMWDTQA